MSWQRKTGLVLAGGGARGAYQVGVLRALREIAKAHGEECSYPIIAGVSAGAVNASFLAAHAEHFGHAVERLEAFWANLRSGDVFRTDVSSLGRIGYEWLADVTTGGFSGTHHTAALLDTAPFGELVRHQIPFDRITTNIRSGYLDGLAVAATDYGSTENVTFFMSADERALGWQRVRRLGLPQTIAASHVLASAAIPFLFPPVNIAGRHYGDGCVRHAAPLSAAVHLGAERLIVVGVRHAGAAIPVAQRLDGSVPTPRPSIAKVVSVMINAVLLEAVELDLERLARINRTVALISETKRAETALRPIDWLYLQPSIDLGVIAAEEFAALPRFVRYLLLGLGPVSEAADIASYLLFEPAFCRRLIELGVTDTLARRAEVESFLRA